MNSTRLHRLQQVVQNINYLKLEGSSSLVEDLCDLSLIPLCSWSASLNQILENIDIYINSECNRSEFLKWIIRGHIQWILADPLLDINISENVRSVAREVHI